MSGYSKRVQYISPEQMDRAIEEIARMTRDAHISAVLVGGCALQFYGSDRLTADIDFASKRSLPGTERLGELSFGGYQTMTPSGVPVDWIVRNDDYEELYEEAIEHSIRIEGVPIAVASPEYLAAMKMVARRRKDEADLEALIRSGLLDISNARKIIKRTLGAYAADDFDAYVLTAKMLSEKI